MVCSVLCTTVQQALNFAEDTSLCKPEVKERNLSEHWGYPNIKFLLSASVILTNGIYRFRKIWRHFKELFAIFVSIVDEEHCPVRCSGGVMQGLMKYIYHLHITPKIYIYSIYICKYSIEPLFVFQVLVFHFGAREIQATWTGSFPVSNEWKPPLTVFLDILSDICCRTAGYNLYRILDVRVQLGHLLLQITPIKSYIPDFLQNQFY